MKRAFFLAGAAAVASAAWVMAQQPAEVSIVEGFRMV